jgi:hypothetical protein
LSLRRNSASETRCLAGFLAGTGCDEISFLFLITISNDYHIIATLHQGRSQAILLGQTERANHLSRLEAFFDLTSGTSKRK